MSEKSTRPLSPHLQVYRWQWSATYSILHRLTGIALSFGTLLIAAWVIALGTSPETFETIHHLLTSWLGIFVMMGFCWALFFHLLNGIRHLFWDMGKGLELEQAKMSGNLVALGSFVLSGIVIVSSF